ncbi:MAG: FAD-binding oxidoreductase [Proteobacteria bacterium]|nr:FAD-binding oxidoreductase [Pseudomonadota bacterium]
MSKKNEVVIIGAGAIGCSIAYHLAKRGIRSTVLDKEAIGSRASGKAWAVVSYPPYILATGQSPDSYFGMPDGESVSYWQDLYWSAYYGMANLVREIKEKGKIDVEFGSVPSTMVAISDGMEAMFKQLMSTLEKDGYHEHQWLTAADLKADFPGINPHVRGGLMLPQLQVEPYKYTLGLAQTAETMGAEFRHGDVVGFDTEGERITSVKLASGNTIEADAVIVAAGPWSGQCASRLGCEIPATITMEECLRLKAPKGFPLHSINCGIEIVSRIDGDVILAVAEVESKSHYFESKRRDDFDTRLSEDIKTRNIETAMNLLPGMLDTAELVEHRGDLLAYGPAPFGTKAMMERLKPA